MKKEVSDILIREFGEKSVLLQDIPDKYAYDESTVYFARPEAVFLPSGSGELLEFMKIAAEHRFPVVPRGTGTGVCGGCVALYGGVVISLERMNRIVELDSDNMCVTVEPGVLNGDLKKWLEARNYYYPPDPQSYETSSIGGNIATNAGGPRAIRYGTTKDYVMGLDIITGDASALKTGGKVYKYSSGYNLNELITGSEGTLGLITSAVLRILPLPAPVVLYFIPFRTIHNATAFLRAAQLAHLPFFAVEFIDDTAKRYVEQHLKRQLPFSEHASCYLFAELEEGMTGGSAGIIEQLMMENEALDVYTALDKNQAERLWEARREVSHAFKAVAKHIYKADVVVPRASIPAFVDEIKKLSAAGTPIACFGHAGDGNIHVNILDLDGTHADAAMCMMNAVMEVVKKYGGFPSGEHGIGVAKKAFLKNFFSEYHIKKWKEIKRVFDPCNILNPGKIIER